MIKLLDDKLFKELGEQSQNSDRKRSHHNLHADLNDTVQRLCISLSPGTYVQPHKHPESYKWEMMVVMTGEVCMLLFDDNGKVTERIELSQHGDIRGIEIPPNTWHTLFPVSTEATILEVKQGPFSPLGEENFASWAPKEKTAEVEAFLSWAANAAAGSQFKI